MRVVCVDKAAADRVRLQNFLEASFEECRRAVGHLSLTLFVPASRDEVVLSAAPDIIAVGSGFAVEESYSLCRDLLDTFPSTPVVVFLAPETYSLRTLRRFERLAAEIFSTDDPAIRVVHKLSAFECSRNSKGSGTLITVNGVKGGVGTTTLTAALAHASEAIGRRATVVDLSLRNNLAHYLGAERLQSPDFTTLITDRIFPQDEVLSRLVVAAPNGIDICLAPAGGHDTRELWLRNPQSFEISLAVIELLRSNYDLVLVDMALAEGVLPFALNARADHRLLVSSNDPASIHLLSTALTQVADTPGEGKLKIVLNELLERALDREDMLDFLCLNDSFSEEMASLPTIPFDARGAHWIGTGNTFFTESNRQTQAALERMLQAILSGRAEQVANEVPGKIQQALDNVKKLLTRAPMRAERAPQSIKGLPLLQPVPLGRHDLAKQVSREKATEKAPVINAGRLKPIDLDSQHIEKTDAGAKAPDLVATASVFSPLFESPVCVEHERE